MPDPAITVALLLLVALVEASAAVRIPIGLLLAIGLLAADAELLPIALIGAVGVMAARLALALAARAGRDRLRPATPQLTAQREQLRKHLADSPAYARITFLLAALPGVPANFIFPLLGAMRAPLWPALAGTVVGRVPVLAVTCALFTWLGRAVSENDDQAAVTLGMLAVLLLVFRTIGRIDWKHRAETGRWRLRDADEHFVRMTTSFGNGSPLDRPGDRRPDQGAGSSAFPGRGIAGEDDGDVLEGEVLGEDVDGDDDEGNDGGGDGDEPSGGPSSELPPGDRRS